MTNVASIIYETDGVHRPVKRAIIDKATAATHEIVAAVAGKKIRVLGFYAVAAGAVVATWKSATTAVTGAMTMATGVAVHAPPAGFGWFETAAGEALNLTLGGAVQVSGNVIYAEV